MPKRKKAAKTSGSGKGKKKQNYLGPILRVLLAVVIIGLIIWFWPYISDWATNTWGSSTDWIVATWEGLLEIFGIGLLFTVVFLGVVIWIIASGRFSLFSRYWRCWLGGISCAFAAWGILAFFSPGSGVASQATLGGKIGSGIIGDSYALGALRIAGLIFLGALFLAPRGVWGVIKSIFIGIGRLFMLIWHAIRQASQRPPKIKPEPVSREIEFGKAEAVVESAPAPPPVIVPPKAVETPPPEAWEPGKYQPVLTAGGWQLPPITILDKPTEVELSQSEIEKRAQLIEEALTSYGVEAKVVQINVGPTVTQFGVEPGWGRNT